jgi:hypothetical protein
MPVVIRLAVSSIEKAAWCCRALGSVRATPFMLHGLAPGVIRDLRSPDAVGGDGE